MHAVRSAITATAELFELRGYEQAKLDIASNKIRFSQIMPDL